MSEVTTVNSGEYLVDVVSCEKRKAASGKGMYAMVSLAIVSGETAGFGIVDFISFIHQNNNFAKKELVRMDELAEACGRKIRRIEDIIGSRLRVNVSVKRDTRGYRNVVDSYLPA